MHHSTSLSACFILCMTTSSLSLSSLHSKIKLLSFDMFAALMDLYSSLNVNIAEILPNLSTNQVETLTNNWVDGYGSYGNYIFDENVTGPYPFQWMLNDTLTTALNNMNLEVTSSEFVELTQSWGDLIPWQGTTYTLTTLYNAGINIAPLSNGDSDTLTRDWKAFEPATDPYTIFSSDFPVGAFKPQPSMYAQVINSGVNIEEYMHIAGAPGDAQGAREYGIYASLSWNTPIPGDYEPCFVLNNITDLLAIFGLE
jgi:FMN phosphatase YigB (HAD superfamily)